VIRLVRVEILRLFSRRLVKIVAGLVLLLVVAIVGIDGYNSAKPAAGDDAAFRQRLGRAYDRDIAAFPQPPPGEGPPGEFHVPSRDEFIANPEESCFGPETCNTRRKEPFVLREKLSDWGVGVALICTIVAFLVGASAAGAEWAAGTMQSLLYWESRRVRVVLAKIVGLSVVIATLVIAAEALYVIAAFPAAELRGSTGDLTGDVWGSYLLLVLRGIGAATFAALLGFAVAFGTRVTAAAVGIGFVYFVILQQLLIVWKPWLIRYMIGPLFIGWFEYGSDFSSDADGLVLSGRRAGITLAIYAAVMVTAATVWFRQRDVT
jgi:hypothetical protein